MVENGGSGAKETPQTQRRERLAAELRANLKKRRAKTKNPKKTDSGRPGDTKKPS